MPLEVICNKASTCKIEKCGMKKPHWHFGCKPCSFDDTAKCVNIKTLEKENSMAKEQKILQVIIIEPSRSSNYFHTTYTVGEAGVTHIITEPTHKSVHGVFIEVEGTDDIKRVYGEVVSVQWSLEEIKKNE